MGKLVIAPTPIGNLKDITLRTLEVLKECDLVLAEDTRNTKFLLEHYKIDKQFSSYHKFNEHSITKKVVEKIKEGKTICLVSDAGTPGISDPGYLLIKKCIEEDIDVETLPGATAFVPALVNSGFSMDSFVFEGFLPHKKGKQSKIKAICDEERTTVLYESPHRLLKTLVTFAEFASEKRRVSVSREITKVYEETVRGELNEVVKHFEKNKPKGEIVVVVEGLKSFKKEQKKENETDHV